MNKYIRLMKRRIRKRKTQKQNILIKEETHLPKKHWLQGSGTRLTSKNNRLNNYRKRNVAEAV